MSVWRSDDGMDADVPMLDILDVMMSETDDEARLRDDIVSEIMSSEGMIDGIDGKAVVDDFTEVV